jgi:hypothetical protein
MASKFPYRLTFEAAGKDKKSILAAIDKMKALISDSDVQEAAFRDDNRRGRYRYLHKRVIPRPQQ